MFVCFNCKQFVSSVNECDNCKKNVCEKCILIGKANTEPHLNSYTKLCSKCQCVGCIQLDKIIVGYDICWECGLQYCDKCYDNTQCKKQKRHIKYCRVCGIQCKPKNFDNTWCYTLKRHIQN